MGTINSKWRPAWWTEEVHGSAWDRVKGAMQRDWAQTKHDLGVGGHEMNQNVTDTLKQAGGSEHLPTMNEANPPKVIGDWNEAEVPYSYGYAAKTEHGARHPVWTLELENKLKAEWMAAQDQARRDWIAVRNLVRSGYEYKEGHK